MSQNYALSGIVLYTLWNVAAFLLVMLDKRRAQRKEWRISEQTFFLWALFFGAVGILLGMYTFRHKIRHELFTVGMPMIGLLNIGCGYFLWQYLWELF